MKNIVFAVPEKMFWRYAIKALEEAGFTVHVCTNADQILAALKKVSCVGLIVDQLLAPGESFSLYETRDGTRTGPVVANRLVGEYPALAIVIMAVDDIKDEVPKQAQVIDLYDMTPRKAVELALNFK